MRVVVLVLVDEAAWCDGHTGRVVSGELVQLEPWLDRRGLAEYLKCSPRWIASRMAEGMPHAIIAGRVKFRASQVEVWLEEHGYLERVNCA